MEKVASEVKRNNMFFVPFSKLKVLEDFNDRQDYGDINELAESMYHSGVKMPIKGYKEGENYVVIVGHRRFRAAEMIKQKYKKTMIFPFLVYPRESTEKDFILDNILTNEGKNLNPLEKASVIGKLIKLKVSHKDITGALGGVSEVYVRNLIKLNEAPEQAKKAIREGIVSATTVIGWLKGKGNIEELIQEAVKLAAHEIKPGKVKSKKTKGKTAAVTAKSKAKHNSLTEFKRYRKQSADLFENKCKQQTFEFVCSLIDNKLSYNDILEFISGK